MKIQVLGPGCHKCEELAKNVHQAIKDSGADCTMEKITDIMEITNFGVMLTPALAIDGEVKSVGKVLSVDEVKKLIS